MAILNDKVVPGNTHNVCGEGLIRGIKPRYDSASRDALPEGFRRKVVDHRQGNQVPFLMQDNGVNRVLEGGIGAMAPVGNINGPRFR